jgi:hypothetical protein
LGTAAASAAGPALLAPGSLASLPAAAAAAAAALTELTAWHRQRPALEPRLLLLLLLLLQCSRTPTREPLCSKLLPLPPLLL